VKHANEGDREMATTNLTYPRGYKVVKTPRHGNRYYSMVHDCWVRYYGPEGAASTS
jgi:hypothetical protein